MLKSQASDEDALERRTGEIGREIFAQVNRTPVGFTERWLDQTLMGWGMRDEQVKAQAFRFIDVLPVLESSRQVAGHLREYLGGVSGRLPIALRGAVSLIHSNHGREETRRGWLDRPVASLTRSAARRMARRFIAAEDLPGAVAAIESLRSRSLTFTIDLLGEAVLSESEAERYQRQYLDLVEGLARAAERWPSVELTDVDDRGQPVPRVNVSVKLSSLYSQFDPLDATGTSRIVRDRLRPILRLARDRGAFVNVDMEQYAYKDVTLRIFKEVFEELEFRRWADVGIAIQAYLRDTEDDLNELAEWAGRRGTPVWVRLVKGAYWDYETVMAAQNDWRSPVFDQKPETDANFERCTALLMEHHNRLRPAIASHNIRSIARALALAERHGVRPRAMEFQMLYGMADPIKSALVSMGQRVRVYTPFGQLLPGMAYLVRRLLENTSNESFLRAGFVDHQPEEQLLMNPLQRLKRLMPARPPTPQTSARRDAPFKNEPLSDFSRAEAQQAMRLALEQVAQQLGRSYPLNINASRIETGKWIDSFNPSQRRQLVGRCAAGTAEDARLAVAAAKAAFPGWRDTGPERRAELMFQCAEVLRRRRFELAAWEVYETGKPWREADADVAEAIDFCEYYAREMLRLASPQRRDVPGEANETFYEPRGVAVVIAPWNFPLAILCGMAAAAVVAGNTVVIKPAEQSPVIAAKLMEVFEAAGVPPGVVNFLSGVGEDVGPALVNSPDVSVIAFTGSRTVGLGIQKQAAEVEGGQDHIKRVITELGGKNAIIVDEDADLDAAVQGVIASAFGYAGQKCSACSRVVVLESVHDTFVSRLVEATRSLKIGPAEDPSNFLGPVIDDEARLRILAQIEKGKAEARLVYAGDIGALSDQGCFVAPHIFADVAPTAAIAQEEIFGPVLAVLKVTDLEEAMAVANSTRYALTGGVYSRSPAHIERVRREFRVGNLYINRKITGALVDRQPFGGFKLSGVGSKAGGPDYLPQFMVPRTVTENTLRRGFAPSDADTAAEPAGE